MTFSHWEQVKKKWPVGQLLLYSQISDILMTQRICLFLLNFPLAWNNKRTVALLKFIVILNKLQPERRNYLLGSANR